MLHLAQKVQNNDENNNENASVLGPRPPEELPPQILDPPLYNCAQD